MEEKNRNKMFILETEKLEWKNTKKMKRCFGGE